MEAAQKYLPVHSRKVIEAIFQSRARDHGVFTVNLHSMQSSFSIYPAFSPNNGAIRDLFPSLFRDRWNAAQADCTITYKPVDSGIGLTPVVTSSHRIVPLEEKTYCLNSAPVCAGLGSTMYNQSV